MSWMAPTLKIRAAGMSRVSSFSNSFRSRCLTRFRDLALDCDCERQPRHHFFRMFDHMFNPVLQIAVPWRTKLTGVPSLGTRSLYAKWGPV